MYDLNLKQLLVAAVAAGGSCSNLGRSIRARTPHTYQEIVDATPNLSPNCTFNERVFWILNDVTSVPIDGYGKPATFLNLFKGYRLCTTHARSIARRKEVAAANLTKLPRTRLTKREQFVRRNQRTNHALYAPHCIEGPDYVICPVTGERMAMITKKHITHVLEMTQQEFADRFPHQLMHSNRRRINIQNALKFTDPVTGLTKHQQSVNASKVSSRVPDDTGTTPIQRRVAKTKATHLSRIDELGRNGYQRQAHVRKTTVLPNGLTVEQNAHIKQKQTCIDKGVSINRGASAQSKRVLAPILDWLDLLGIPYYFDNNEFGLRDSVTGNYYFYDLVIRKFNIAIEYQSHAFHANPQLSNDDWINWTPAKGPNLPVGVLPADYRLTYDYTKARSLYQHRGFHMFYVWEASEQQDVERILCLMQTMNMKS